MRKEFTPDEDLRKQLRQKIAEDPRGLQGVAGLVGVKASSLHEFLNKPGAGSRTLPKLIELFGLEPPGREDLDTDERELLRVLALARAEGRNAADLVQAFKTMTGIDPKKPRPGPPRSRGTGDS